MSQRSEDVALLRKLVGHRAEVEEDPFADMLDNLETGERAVLSQKQREWAKGELEKFEPAYENLVSDGKVPRGREVELLVKDKPLFPPGRRPR